MLISHLTSSNIGHSITLQGWIVHARSSGKIAFLELRDGSGFIQCIVEEKNIGTEKFEQISKLSIESALEVTGTLSKHPKKDEYEIHVQDFTLYTSTQDYPLGQKEHGPDFLFDQRHLYLRAKSQRAILRIRDTIIHATYDRFRDNDFIKIDSPVFTPNAAEDSTELYEVEHVNGEKMFLSQTGQLYLEAAIAAHRNVYDFGPVFRAEKHKTRRHLNELWMMDAEMAFCDQEGNMEIQEKLIYYIIQEVLKKNRKELEILERDISKLEQITLPFVRKDYKEVITELQSMGSDITLGKDLGADDETMLMERYTQPVFVTGYPSEIKAFYMKEDEKNPGYVRNADLLAPEGYGEVIGGSQREADYDILLEKIKKRNLPVEQYSRYLDTRKFGGVPHAGFGFGLERLVRRICGLHHIREAIPFPRYANRITP